MYKTKIISIASYISYIKTIRPKENNKQILKK